MDLISRQAAIDAILAIKDYGNSDRANALGLAECAVTTLPSVQPEVIRCKDCKWCGDADGLICKNTASWVVATDYDFGCVCAERRQDG